jgi:replicative DNA helicase
MATPSLSGSPGRVDRVPPHSEEAERGVLGSILMDAGRVVDLAIERQIRPESYYIPAHRVLYENILDLHEKGRPIDLLTVGDRLRDAGQLDRLGGRAALEALIDACPTSAHAEYYIDIVRAKFLLRRVIDCSREAIEHCYKAEDGADFILDRAEQQLFDISNDQRRSAVSWGEAVRDTMVHIEKIFETKSGLTGLATGFADLDKVTSGLQRSDMIIIAARPSMGKTSLAMNIAENVAMGIGPDHAPKPVAIFSLEMPRESLVRRMLCSRANIGGSALRGGYVSPDMHNRLVRAADELTTAPIYVDDSAGLEAVELRARARRLKKKHDVQLIVIDYLQMLNYSELAREGRQRETAAISGALKAMAKELRVPVLVLSQLSRAPETRDAKSAVPKLSDLRDSGSIEQDADVVMLLRRPCRYKDDAEFNDKRLAYVDIAKHRNGPTAEVKLNFMDETTRFENRHEGVDQPGYQPSQGAV